MHDSFDAVANFPPEQRAIWNKCFLPAATFAEFKRDEIEQSVVRRFEQQVARYPGRIAVRSTTHTLTYDELNRAANRIARAILDRSGAVQQPTAVLFEHGAPFVIASLGVLKAGGVPVSLESGFPQARLQYMLEQSNASMLVTDGANLPLARQFSDLALVNIDEIGDRFADDNPGVSVGPDAFAAIAYTSGSTGTPKGVVWNQRGLLHAVMRHTNMFRVCADDRMVMFRASLRPCLYALLNGATCYPVALRDEAVLGLGEWLAQEKITIYRSAVSTFRSFAGTLAVGENFPHLRLILLFGEQAYHADVALYSRHFARTSIFVSSLGCLEFDDYAYYFVDRDTPLQGDAIPGGYPVADVEILLLDDSGRPVGADQVGEIAIVSRHNPVGQWQKGNPMPAASARPPGSSEASTYLTGDLGRRGSDGCLFHHGRKDFQVKIRGYRVALTEIEAALLDIDGVKAAAVAGWEDAPGHKRVVAYIVPEGARVPPVAELRRILGAKLPDYMLPSTFITLDALPLTPTGKIDRRALPSPGRARPALKSAFVAPRTPLEEELAQLWADMLGVEGVGVHDGFLELGGDSLLATQLVSRVLTQFHVRVPLRALFDAPTVADMAALLTERDTDENRHRIVEELKILRTRTRAPFLAERQSTVTNHTAAPLWAITCYFNPVGYKRRLENYRVFRRRLAVPLVAVELSFDGSFQLHNDDADILVRIHGRDVMWQKERLLNIALERVPKNCAKIAWLDCDIVFGSEDWAEEATRALDTSVVVHLFDERHDLPREVDAGDLPSWNALPTSYSVVAKLAAGEAGPEDLFLADAPLQRKSTAGLAWAARRDVLEKHGLYDACILGTGDRVILCAALGKLDYGARTTLMNDRWRRHYLAWARPFSASVMGRVGSVRGPLFHLWHGDMRDRLYGERHSIMQAFEFDPSEDIALDEDGCWRWNSDKKAMHRFVRTYFESRNEDGAPEPRAVQNLT